MKNINVYQTPKAFHVILSLRQTDFLILRRYLLHQAVPYQK